MAKQTAKKNVIRKSPVKHVPVMEHSCGCGKDCPCGCHRHGSAHVIKHIIVWAIIFALGMACGKMMNCGHGRKMPRQIQPVFTNGCLDITSIKCPKMAEEVVAADVNSDDCISIEEYKTWKRANRQKMNENDKGIRHGMRGFKKPR